MKFVIEVSLNERETAAMKQVAQRRLTGTHNMYGPIQHLLEGLDDETIDGLRNSGVIMIVGMSIFFTHVALRLLEHPSIAMINLGDVPNPAQ